MFYITTLFQVIFPAPFVSYPEVDKLEKIAYIARAIPPVFRIAAHMR